MKEVRTLPNGIRVVMDPMPGIETAAIGVWARAGTIDEREDEHGVAHLLEHMAFKGTAGRSARAIADEIESVGGYLNAATSYQRTGYYARVLSADIGLAADILEDILFHSRLDAGELMKEQEVVIQEIGEANDNPDDAVGELLQTLAFRGQSLGRSILGTVESVRSHAPARLREFLDRHYRGDALVISASGGFEKDTLFALVSQKFAQAPVSTRMNARPEPVYGGGARHDARDIEQTHLCVAFPAVGARHDDYLATRIFAEAFGGGMASRLFQTIREDRGLAYSVYGFADCYDDAGIVGAYAGTDSENAEEALALIRTELAAMADRVTDAEVNRARAVIGANILMGLESPMNRAEMSAAQIFTYGAPVSVAAMRERLRAVTPEDVRRIASRALTERPPSLAVVGPARFDSLCAAVGAQADAQTV